MNTIAIINIARQQLDMAEDDYRAMLLRVTGKASLRNMTERQRIDVVEELKRKGFRVRSGGRQVPASARPYVRLIHALWASCARLGVIENGSRGALRAFCHRFVGDNEGQVFVDPDLLSYEQATPIIEALKKMEARGRGAGRS